MRSFVECDNAYVDLSHHLWARRTAVVNGDPMGKKRPKRQPKKITTDVIETQALSLVDEYGIERASLSCAGGDGGRGGSTQVQLNDDQGTPKLSLEIGPDGNPYVTLFGAGGEPAVNVGINDAGPGITVRDGRSSASIQLAVPARAQDSPIGDAPQIIIADREGNCTFLRVDNCGSNP